MNRRVYITDFLTEREIKQAQELKTARRIHDEIIKPSINRINKDLGQKNDPMYLAYVVEYVIGLSKE